MDLTKAELLLLFLSLLIPLSNKYTRGRFSSRDEISFSMFEREESGSTEGCRFIDF